MIPRLAGRRHSAVPGLLVLASSIRRRRGWAASPFGFERPWGAGRRPSAFENNQPKEAHMTDSKDKPITSWPPKAPVRQVTKAELSQMTPEAINSAREAGALDDLLKGRPEPPA